MMLKRQATESKPKPNRLLSSLRIAGAALGVAAVSTSVVTGCLKRPVTEQDPHTSNVFVAEIRQTAVDKIDLLMMIDNSISMADKQSILGDAVGSLVQRLVAPLCVDASGAPTGVSAGNDGRCAGQSSPEFSPIKDIHVGIVSSSLGSHGSSGACNDATGDDHGQFVATVRQDFEFTPWPAKGDPTGGFLAWDPDMARPRNNPPGIQQQDVFATHFKNMVLNVGQSGCGFESSLEGWYRFLIEPEPNIQPTPVVMDSRMETKPIFSDNIQNNIVLQQRSRFLRQDSLLAVIMLSDENDCSIVEYGQGWLVGTSTLSGNSFNMPRATSQCEGNPNDKCCSSCAAPPAAGCPDPKTDAQCQINQGSWSRLEDAINLRCYNQKRRFGFDLLYPTSRYVNGLYELKVPKHDGTMVTNPIYASSPQRDRSLVFLAGIVGVPWQDIAKDPNAGTLQYMNYADMVTNGRWDMILGNPGDPATGMAPTPPGDKLMFETPQDRSVLFGTGPHPVIGPSGALAPNTAMGQPNAINGHESKIDDNTDLQYACIFKLPEARTACTGPGCDCSMIDPTTMMPTTTPYNRPLCNGMTQTHAKAFPGLRELQVLKDFGAKGTQNSIVASICPKTLEGDKSAAGYGYNPAVSAIVERLKEALRGKCLPRKLVPDERDMGRVPCKVVESNVPATGQACDCNTADKKGRVAVTDPDLRAAVYHQLHESSYCGDENNPPCDSFCLCEIQQFTDTNLARCQSETTTPTDIYGYCYVDPSTAMDGSPAQNAQNQIVASCPPTQKRLLRFTGENVPAKGAIAMIACLGATVTGN